MALDSSAAPRLGQAIALAEAGVPQRALALLQALQPELPAALLAHLLAAQARAHERLGDMPQAKCLLLQAVAAAPHAADARALAQRAAALVPSL